MKSMITKTATATVVATFLAAAIAGCGGGGSSTPTPTPAPTPAPAPTPTPTASLKGIAAGGAAVTGTVTVTDSIGGTASADIAADGTFTVDVTSLTAPFILHALGKIGNLDVSYYAPATADDLTKNINVTPLSSLIISFLSGDAPENCSTTCISGLTSTKISDANAILRSKLAATLTELNLDSTKTDLLHDAFTAGSSVGLDSVLDILSISIDANTKTITITDLLTGQSVSGSIVNSTDNSEPLPAGSGVTDIVLAGQVKTRYAEINAILSSDDAQDQKVTKLKEYCSADFSLHGKNCADGMKEIAVLGPRRLEKIAAYDLAAIDQFDSSVKPTDQNVATVFKLPSRRNAWLWKKASDGKFLLAGDGGKKAYVDFYSLVWNFNGIADADIEFYVGVNGDGSGTPFADSITVTGPGLNGPIHTNLSLRPLTDEFWETPSIQSSAAKIFAFSDPNGAFTNGFSPSAVAAGVANGTPYILTLEKGGQVVATYKQTLLAAPYDAGTLSAANFPVIQNLPPLSLAKGGAYTPNITLPEGYETLAVGLFADKSSPYVESVNQYFEYSQTKNLTFTVPSAPSDQSTRICVFIRSADTHGHLMGTEQCTGSL